MTAARPLVRYIRETLVVAAVTLVWAAVVIAFFVAEAYWWRRPPVTRGDLRSIESHLAGRLEDAAEDRRLGSAALALMHDGQIVAMRGFGVANADSGAPVNPERTLYQLASVSKAVSAWGVMTLVEEGKLDLDEPVVRHLTRWRFPGSEPYGGRVTARHLLSHTGGLLDGLGYGGFAPGETVPTLEESLLEPRDSRVGEPRPVRAAREPGTMFAYSGGGYTILQLLIEEVTGQSFAAYMKEAVLMPLGMKSATFEWNDLAAEGRSADLATAWDHDVRPASHRVHTAKASVALYATARDLGQFLLAFVRPDPVLTSATLDQMLTPQPATAEGWGLGHTLFVRSENGSVWGHDGGTTPAWGAMLRVNRETKNGMALLISGGRGAANQLGHDWVYWETGVITPQARRQYLYDRSRPAAAAILAGLLLVIFWRTRRRPRSPELHG